MRSKLKEKLWIGVLITSAVTLLAIVSISEYSLNKQIELHQIRGVLEAMEKREKNVPYFKVNGQWLTFSYRGIKLMTHCELGDSLSKDGEHYVVNVFRKVEG